MLAYSLGNRAEDDAQLLEPPFESGGDGDRVEHGINRDAGERRAFSKRDTELFVGPEQLGVHFIEALWLLAPLRGGVIVNLLVVDLGIGHARPGRFPLLRLLPEPERFQTPVEKPLRLFLLGRNEADGVLVEALRREVRLDVGDEAIFVVALQRAKRFDRLLGCGHGGPSMLSPELCRRTDREKLQAASRFGIRARAWRCRPETRPRAPSAPLH